MNYSTITDESGLRDFCASIESADQIGFDTEFVSEDTYWPQLCLVQVASADKYAVIDPLEVRDLGPFWRLLGDESRETIVHAGREELIFVFRELGKPPARLFDLQLAAGLVGFEYPAGYAALTQKLMNERPPKGETRTDWRRRPLTQQQLHYALSDVKYLLPMREILGRALEDLGRTEWMVEESTAWQADILDVLSKPRWRRVSGISGLSTRALIIVRELWHWREKEAETKDRPPRRILRDDLLIELAKRGSGDPRSVQAIRGIERTYAGRCVPEIAAAIARANEIPESDLGPTTHHSTPNQVNMLGQFLSTALTSICKSAHVAASLAGTASDVRDLVAWQLGYRNEDDELPSLATGWRAEVVGTLLEDLLLGRNSIRISDPHSDHPLTFEANGSQISHGLAEGKKPPARNSRRRRRPKRGE